MRYAIREPMNGADRILDVHDPDDAAPPEPAALGAEGPTVDAVAGLASPREALSDLLEPVLSHADADRRSTSRYGPTTRP